MNTKHPKPPLAFIRTLIIVEVAAGLVYFVAGLLGYYAKLYRSYPVAKYIPFHVAQAIFIFGVQAIILFIIYKKWTREYKSTPEIKDLISSEESENLEFKSSFRWDVKEGKVNKSLEKAAMKTIAAFLNTHGGHLIIGIDDNKNIIGLEKDLNSLPKPNEDGFENHFSNVFHNTIGPTFRQYVDLAHVDLGGSKCCVVSVAPSANPVFFKMDDKNEEFYIRTGNGTTSLKMSETNRYINNRFNKKISPP